MEKKYTIYDIIDNGLIVLCGNLEDAKLLFDIADSNGFGINGEKCREVFKDATYMKKCYNLKYGKYDNLKYYKDNGYTVIEMHQIETDMNSIEKYRLEIEVEELRKKNANLEHEAHCLKTNADNDKTIAVEDAVREVSNKYFEVFKILSEDNIDWKELGLRLANNHPEIFLKVSLKYPNTKHLSMQMWYDHAIKEVESGKKIRAIKYVRECTGLGLRESKAIVDDLAECMGL